MTLQELMHELHSFKGGALWVWERSSSSAPADGRVPRRRSLRRGDPRFLVLYHCAMCYDARVNVSLRYERQVTHAPCASARSCVLGTLAVLPSRPAAYVELWHVYGWGRLCQHCAEHGGKLREFLATLLHRHGISNLLSTSTVGVLATVMGVSSVR
jgi:hypothetical protein